MKLDKAKIIADDIIARLSPFCEHCLIAGSIRQEKEDVKDIEIVALPKYRLTSFPSDPYFDNAIRSIGTIKKGQLNGRYIQIHAHQGIMVDLFLPQPTDFWRIFAMRTGSRAYSQNVIARGWNAIGWVGTQDGLRLESQCDRHGKAGVWKCGVKNPVLPPSWASEEEFFQWLEVPFTHPRDRDTVKEEDIQPRLDIFQKIEAGHFTPLPEPEPNPDTGLTVGMLLTRLKKYPKNCSVVLHVCDNTTPGHLSHDMVLIKSATRNGNQDDLHDVVVIGCKAGIVSLREKYRID